MNHNGATRALVARLQAAANSKEILGAAVNYRERWLFGEVLAEGSPLRWHVWIAAPRYQPDARRSEVLSAAPQEFDARHDGSLRGAIVHAIQAAIFDRQSHIEGCYEADRAIPLPVWEKQRVKYEESLAALLKLSEDIRAMKEA